MSFESAMSRRLRVGARYKWNAGDIHPYIGAAWEREFDGKMNASINGFPLGASSMAGNTGIFELGFIYDPSDSPWSMEFGVSGSTGARDGMTGTIRLEYAF
jgi:outer membrane autotransporter protein